MLKKKFSYFLLIGISLLSIGHFRLAQAANEICTSNADCASGEKCERHAGVNICMSTQYSGDNAAIGNIETPSSVEKWGGVDTGLVDIINTAINFLIFIAAAWFVFNILRTGLKIITSVLNPTQLAEALKKLVWNVVGLVIVVFAFIIVGWVSKMFFGSEDIITSPSVEVESSSSSKLN